MFVYGEIALTCRAKAKTDKESNLSKLRLIEKCRSYRTHLVTGSLHPDSRHTAVQPVSFISCMLDNRSTQVYCLCSYKTGIAQSNLPVSLDLMSIVFDSTVCRNQLHENLSRITTELKGHITVRKYVQLVLCEA